MYRSAGAQSVLSGVLSGPFTGGPRRIDSARLAPAVRERLSRALVGRAEPSPIAYEHPVAVAGARASWGIVLSIAILSVVFAIGFANPNSAWAMQPRWAFSLYGGAGLLFAFSLLAVVRRRALVGGDALRPGRYLFPLDVVDIALPDASGRQLITARSLGSAREAKIERAGNKTDLVIAFGDATSVRFPLRGDASGEVALRRLEHAQHLIEDLTYSKSLEQAFVHDLFFELRVDDSWGSVVPGRADAAARSSAVLRPIASALAFVLALFVGAVSFGARQVFGDQALFNHAVREATPEALDRYIARGGAHAHEATELRDAIVRAREPAPLAKEDFPPEPPSPKQCLATLRAHQAPKHPEVFRIMETLIERTAEREIPFVFTRKIAPTLDRASDLDEREETMVHAFGRVFSESCPANVVRFVRRKEGSEPVLEVKYEVTRAFTIVFDVRFHGYGENATFRLTMPPPAEPQKAIRPRSIFKATTDPNAILTARAFDRLYDEIHGLFFEGDPRVPLVLEPGP